MSRRPVEAARLLAQRRENGTRTHLVEAAGIERDRLVGVAAQTADADGEPRVEFGLKPAS